jgi:hypothetical protein
MARKDARAKKPPPAAPKHHIDDTYDFPEDQAVQSEVEQLAERLRSPGKAKDAGLRVLKVRSFPRAALRTLPSASDTASLARQYPIALPVRYGLASRPARSTPAQQLYPVLEALPQDASALGAATSTLPEQLLAAATDSNSDQVCVSLPPSGLHSSGQTVPREHSRASAALRHSPAALQARFAQHSPQQPSAPGGPAYANSIFFARAALAGHSVVCLGLHRGDAADLCAGPPVRR